MKKVNILFVVALCCLLSGCFQIEGVHVLHYYGENDTGSYRITMNQITYGLLTSDKDYADTYRKLKSWSRPVTRYDHDLVHLEDARGTASMEHFYDVYNCKAASISGYMDCRFAFKMPDELAKLQGWSIDWTVVLQPGMRIVSSNHQRTRREDGRDELLWWFDGDQESAASVDFTARVPRAQ